MDVTDVMDGATNRIDKRQNQTRNRKKSSLIGGH